MNKVSSWLFTHRHELLYSVLLLLLILLKVMVLEGFQYRFVDGDQVIQWHGLVDFARGEFHEPRFYGQAYNTMMESLLAVPLYRMGMDPEQALPLVTTVMGLFPFVFFSILCWRNDRKLLASFVLLTAISLPVEYDILSVMPRGFITGTFIASLAMGILFKPKEPRWIVALAVCSVLGYGVNPGSVILSIALCAYAGMVNIKNPAFYKYFIPSAAIAYIPVFLADRFYRIHPEYIVHRLPDMHFQLENLMRAFNELDKHMGEVAPFYWYRTFVLVLLFATLIVFLFRQRKYRAGMAAGASMFFALATLGLDKIHDGTNNIFFAYNRMFMALPLVLISFSSFIRFPERRLFFPVMLVAALAYVPLKQKRMLDLRHDRIIKENWAVPIRTTQEVQEICRRVHSLARSENAGLIMMGDHCDAFFVVYGCPARDTTFTPVIWPARDRRRWRMLEEENKVYEKVMVMDDTPGFEKRARARGIDIQRFPTAPEHFIIRNNKLPVIELARQLGFRIRKY